MIFSLQESLHSVGSWKHEMERYNVGPHRKNSVWMMAGHKIRDQDYAGFISQADVRVECVISFLACTCLQRRSCGSLIFSCI